MRTRLPGDAHIVSMHKIQTTGSAVGDLRMLRRVLTELTE